jgi:hypothetical protein
MASKEKRVGWLTIIEIIIAGLCGFARKNFESAINIWSMKNGIFVSCCSVDEWMGI